MLFNSLEFALFLPLVVGLYFMLPAGWRTPLLLLASCVFYAAFIPAYILILLVTIVIDYVAGIYLERVADRHRRPLLIVSIVATCAVLFVFKYFYFFTDSFIGVAGFFGWNLSEPTLRILLPIGLSFHTFQSLSYVVEVYKRRQAPEKNFITYATFVMFFPQLVAGPIERPQNLLHQFHETHAFDYDRVTSGLKRIAWGFFKKLVVADRLALYVNDVYGSPQSFNGLQLTLATVFFAYQIYCDFSGYSDIAIGSARILGFKLMENFDTPYRARTIAEFWHRWHISLSTWFRDYVYIPLGGSRVPRHRWYLNLLIVFGLSGLWHGANWTYVVWGLLNGIFLIGGVMIKPMRERIYRACGIRENGVVISWVEMTITFILVCVGWVIFRAQNLPDAGYILTHFWKDWDFGAIRTENFLLRQLPVAVLSIMVLELVQYGMRRGSLSGLVSLWPSVARWSFYTAAVVVVVLFGVYRKSQFIYFQF
jgi:D-alanyl-lipoteichoic acid acyltransferase DltB (MBOAT superfamily)